MLTCKYGGSSLLMPGADAVLLWRAAGNSAPHTAPAWAPVSLQSQKPRTESYLGSFNSKCGHLEIALLLCSARILLGLCHWNQWPFMENKICFWKCSHLRVYFLFFFSQLELCHFVRHFPKCRNPIESCQIKLVLLLLGALWKDEELCWWKRDTRICKCFLFVLLLSPDLFKK
jgi:hypothetical protein